MRQLLVSTILIMLLSGFLYKLYCITNLEQIEVMELEQTVDPLVINYDALTIIDATHKLDRRRVLLTTAWTCRGKIF